MQGWRIFITRAYRMHSRYVSGCDISIAVRSWARRIYSAS